ncbi:glycosyltransferase family 39 protein [Jimgerdemannia flammicorona]|uniref:Dolichyl-phosphate-mannose--protein mannosyltransferase n=1 Tax=Jimgerdemannia flammicorona TaxID=994334 RepID=A0A433QL45_9FUNG|nr:glycosyltransferase family 39 protein [Jimgerdemannia flammicorona]
MPESSVRRRHPEKTEIHPVEEDDKRKGPAVVHPVANDALSNVVLAVLTVLGFLTRFYNINDPAEVVFDEVHFGKFASYYLKNIYFFDVHPPLAKMMLAAVGYLIGYDGHFEFDNIGDDYVANNVPYVAIRSLPASLGALAVPLTYLIMKESGYPALTAALSASLVLLDNSLITQTRLILLDSMLMFFMLTAIYAYIRFYKLRKREFSTEWWTWLIISGVTMAMTLSVKMVGLLLIATIGVAVLYDLWNLLDIRRGLTMQHFMKHFYARAFGLIFVPIVVYLFWFYVHFSILTISGPGDAFMSPAFQETLKGNSMMMNSLSMFRWVGGIMRIWPSTVDIRYGDNITVMHKETKVYLHSHIDKYPLRYEDGRISSQGQQVTGYPHKDLNNFWRVKPADDDENIDLDNPSRIVRHGEIIRLEHILTRSHLLTHDVASPLMPTNQEITTISVDDDGRRNETLFQLLIEGTDDHGTAWKTTSSYFKLIHMDTKVAVWTHSKALPEWAFKQQEVNGNKNSGEKSNIWFSDEIQGMNGGFQPQLLNIRNYLAFPPQSFWLYVDALPMHVPSIPPTTATEINASKQKPLRKIPFILKFFELQRLMISHNSGLTKPHPYQSTPINWPFMVRGISFWTQNDSRRQIYLIGNAFGWWTAVGSMAVLVGVMIADTLARRRGYEPIEEAVRSRLVNSAGFFFTAWVFHYIPFFLMGRSLFLHHYLPALICSYLVYGAVFQFMFIEGVDSPSSEPGPHTKPRFAVKTAYSWQTYLSAAIILGAQVAVFLWFAPITYGSPGLDVAGVKARQWLSTWDLHFAK